jgi:uncharacterized protein DUF2877
VPILPAHLVATPVLERLGHATRGVVLGAGATAAWVEADGFVVAVTTREVPLLPNAVALPAGSGSLAGVAPGRTARLAPGRVDLGAVQVTWDPASPPAWDPTVRIPDRSPPGAVAGRGAALLQALGIRPDPATASAGPDPPALVRQLARGGLATAADPGGAAGLVLLLRAVQARDPEPAAAASRELLGRGPGLTPEGDDLLAAAAGTLAVLGPATSLKGPALAALLAALAPLPGRTTALSATLLTLARDRRLAEPAGRLLDLDPAAGAALPAALSRLERLGHGSGRAYVAGIAATATLLGSARLPHRRPPGRR